MDNYDYVTQDIISQQTKQDVLDWFNSPEAENVTFGSACAVSTCLTARFFQHLLNDPTVIVGSGVSKGCVAYTMPEDINTLKCMYDSRMPYRAFSDFGEYTRDEVRAYMFPPSLWQRLKDWWDGTT